MRALVLAAPLALLACSAPPPPPSIPVARPDPCGDAGTGVLCTGDLEVSCSSGRRASERNCTDTGGVCLAGVGCRACRPSTSGCLGNDLARCNADGTGLERLLPCDAARGEFCSTAGCVDLCAEAVAQRAYIGCEYHAVPTLNGGLPGAFSFAVAIANPQLVPAEVRITRGGANVASVTIAPGALDTVKLPWIDALKDGASGSSLVPSGSYRISSNVPVTVYQFNPLEFRLDQDCPDSPSDRARDGVCFSFQNDASLLFPTHALTGNYLAVSRPSLVLSVEGELSGTPGFLALVGTSDTPTRVDVTFTARTQASADGAVRAFAPGETGTFMLGRDDVLQLLSAVPATCPVALEPETANTGRAIAYCPVGADYDLTGTIVRASAPIAAIGGHECAFVPYNRWACDHLEESLFPIEAWGTEVFAVRTKPVRSEPNLLRIVSSAEANQITFQPAVHAPLTLARGAFTDVIVSADVVVRGTGPLAVAQFLVGQDYTGLGSAGNAAQGDPSMSFAVPSEQWRSDYTFLAPSTYTTSFVGVIGPESAEVLLDGAPMSGYTPVEGTVFRTARAPIRGGVHRITSRAKVGILVYGFGAYTSYLYPGGLDLRLLQTPF